jgi:putative copper resistance protein D
MIELDSLAILLRALIYAGSIVAAGGVFFSLSFPQAARHVESSLRRQIVLGCWLLVLVEPLRYVTFQLAIAEGNWLTAFAPEMRWMALQTAIGTAAAARLIAALVMLTTRLRSAAISFVAALVMMGSFVMEGHTVSAEARPVLAPLLLLHFGAACWWLGALYPLLTLIRQAPSDVVTETARAFGQRAAWVVGTLVVAGVVLLVALCGAELRLDNHYQQRFVVKLALVAGLLSLAAWNKQRLTPLLETDYASGALKLRRSIRCEMVVALAILAATAWIVSTSPDS